MIQKQIPISSPRFPVNQPEAHLKDLNNVLGQGTIVVEITTAKSTIGRDPRNDIVINRPTISGLHATIEYKYPAFYLEDQRSTNGTRINNRELLSNMPARLKNGDRIQLATSDFLFVIPNQTPFGDMVMLSMTPLEGPEPGSTIVLDLESVNGEQGLIDCLQRHLLQLYSLGSNYRTFTVKHFTHEIKSAIAARALTNLTRTSADNRQHCASFVQQQTLYLICSIPVTVNQAPEWYSDQYGGFTRFILQWFQSDLFKSMQCNVLCIITFGQAPSTWVSLTIVNTHQDDEAVEIMSVDFLNSTEKTLLALDFDPHGRAI